MTGRFSHLEAQNPDQPSGGFTVASQVGEPIRGADYHYRAAVAASQHGRFDDALRCYTKALGVDRKLMGAWVGQVCMLIELDECIEAATWSEKALQVFKGHGDLLAARASALARSSRLEDAVIASDEAMSARGNSALRWRARADVLFAGSRTRAGDCLRQSVAVEGADWFDYVLGARTSLHHQTPVVGHDLAVRGTELNPVAPFAWYTRGQIEQSLGMASKAYQSFIHAAQLDPTTSRYAIAAAGISSRGTLTRLRDFTRGLFFR
jgi:tetratricopeptide (TPR) repeat protein